MFGVLPVGDGYVRGLDEVADPEALHVQVAVQLATCSADAFRLVRLGLDGLLEVVDVLPQLTKGCPNLLDLGLNIVKVSRALPQLLGHPTLRGSVRAGLWGPQGGNAGPGACATGTPTSPSAIRPCPFIYSDNIASSSGHPSTDCFSKYRQS